MTKIDVRDAHPRQDEQGSRRDHVMIHACLSDFYPTGYSVDEGGGINAIRVGRTHVLMDQLTMDGM